MRTASGQANEDEFRDHNPSQRRPRYRGPHPRRFEQRYKELNPQAYPEMQEHVRAQGRTPAGSHVPIMVAEALTALRPALGEVVVDCTVGYGGHALEFLEAVGPTGRLIGLDVDGPQLERTRQRLAGYAGSLSLRHSHFAGVGKALAAEGLTACDILFADLGVSSMQVDDPTRGFSFKHDGPLDMRMDLRRGATAADLLMSLSREELSTAFRDLADEPDHARIADAIVARRTHRAIERTGELADLILSAKGRSRRDLANRQTGGVRTLHPAARTFQALRMMVNDELGGIQQLLRIAPYCLSPKGRIGIISFHSGEDRLVKHAFRAGMRSGVYSSVSDGVVRPDPVEIRINPRSSAAKFRWAVKSG